MRTKTLPALLALAAILIASGSAMAQGLFGLRAGVSADPTQFHFGPHYVSDPLIANLTFRPNMEIGLGNDVTTAALNAEFAYGIPLSNRDATLYIGAGPALNIYRHDSDTDAGGGFNILVGLEHENGMFGEVKVGTIDSPEFKFTVGFTFK